MFCVNHKRDLQISACHLRVIACHFWVAAWWWGGR